MKSRTDAKANKGSIMNALSNYARFGAKNPSNYVLSEDELKNVTAQELVDRLHNLNKYSHQVLYYGPQSLPLLNVSLKMLHKVPASFTPAPAKASFTPVQNTGNKVLFADYNMVQAETRWIRNNSAYDPAKLTVVDVFNNYFGAGMGALVFQTIRESKALAYSTFAFVITPDKKEDPFYTLAYVGSQADKFKEATVAMNELLTDLPEIKSNLDFAKISLKKDIETQRITQDGIIMNFLDAEQKGLTQDVRIQKYAAIDKITFNDLKAYHAANLSAKPFTYAIVASEAKIKKEDLEKLGEFKKLSLEELFGY
jgi:predicted Zn-dependent peptidase